MCLSDGRRRGCHPEGCHAGHDLRHANPKKDTFRVGGDEGHVAESDIGKARREPVLRGIHPSKNVQDAHLPLLEIM